MSTAGAPAARLPDSWADPAVALEQRTASVDAVVCESFAAHLAPVAPEGVALLAVGGYGRRELFPYSDVDLLLLTEKPAVAERQRAAIAAFLQSLWDKGLRISHSVRTVAECSEVHDQNIELNVSLLDQRFLAGDRGLHAILGVALARFVHGQRQALARHLTKLARERHAKYGHSIHHLEPNVKECPGGLRDLQVSHWLALLHAARPDVLPRPEAPADLEPARKLLFAIRLFLHQHAGRDSNVLTFDLQEELADRLVLSPAALMRQYYERAREVHREADRAIEAVDEQSSSLLVQFRDWRSRISTADFTVSRERVYFRAPQRLDADPLLAIRVFAFAGRHGMRPSRETERRLLEFAPRLKQTLEQPPEPLWPHVKDVLSQPRSALALRAMHDTGVLAAVFPEWKLIECLVIRDFYHRYTVDEHTLRTIQTLEDLRTAADPSANRFTELYSEVDEPELLIVSLLFHDTGKAFQGRHVPESVRLAGQAMDRIGMPAEQQKTVRELIGRHLELSQAMTSRDLDDPATARLLAHASGTVEFLKKLTLLTYADVNAVNPTAMSPWRREQLWRAYVVAYNELTRELATERIADALLAGVPGASEFLEGFPVRYLQTHSEPEIAAHFELAKLAQTRGVAVDIRKDNGFYRLTVIAHDRPSLLASIAGALAGFGMNILKAEGFANRRGTILDTFVFADPHRTLELNPPETDRLRLTLERVTLGRLDVHELLRNRPVPRAPSKRAGIPPAVSFDPQASDTATLIQVVAEDRPGLLYALASAISAAGANIELVLIDTEAHKAIDVFYVTLAGRKLAAAEQDALRDRLAAACRA